MKALFLILLLLSIVFGHSESDIGHDPLQEKIERTPAYFQELERNPGSTPPLKQTFGQSRKEIINPEKVANFPGKEPLSAAMGPEDAPVPIFVYISLRCSACTRTLEPLKEIVKQFDGKAQVIFKNFAASNNQKAYNLARIGIALAQQGYYWEFLNELWAPKPSEEDADSMPLSSSFAELKTWIKWHYDGLDRKKFEADLESSADFVDWETAEAKALGCTATPCVMVGDRAPLSGWGDYGLIERTVQSVLHKKK